MKVLGQVKASLPGERRKLFAGARSVKAALEAECGAGRKRRIRWLDAAARRRRIFGDKVPANGVMLARDEERC